MTEEPENTTFIARTGRGWARSPIQEEAAVRALVNSYPSTGETYKVQIFRVSADDWRVSGLGAIQSEYVEKVNEYMIQGEHAERISDLHHEMVMCLGAEGEPIPEEERDQ